jgi:hypothetical protein
MVKRGFFPAFLISPVTESIPKLMFILVWSKSLLYCVPIMFCVWRLKNTKTKRNLKRTENYRSALASHARACVCALRVEVIFS